MLQISWLSKSRYATDACRLLVDCCCGCCRWSALARGGGADMTLQQPPDAIMEQVVPGRPH
jgi:hypothetical protein